MHARLEHLMDVSDRYKITVQVVPVTAGAHVGLLGAFAIAAFENAPGIVYMESPGTQMFGCPAASGEALGFPQLSDGFGEPGEAHEQRREQGWPWPLVAFCELRTNMPTCESTVGCRSFALASGWQLSTCCNRIVRASWVP